MVASLGPEGAVRPPSRSCSLAITSWRTAVDLGSISNISNQYQQFNFDMKNINNKLLVFYYFQQQSNRDYNVTTISNSQSPTIKDLLTVLPFDLSHGLYHFRFKSQLNDGDEKVLAWIDINNIMAKVPQVNGSIYMKILKLSDPSHNKLFHLQKLKKAQIIKINGISESIVLNKPQNNTNNSPSVPNVRPNPNTPVQQQRPPVQQPKNSPSLLQPVKAQLNTQKPPTIPVSTNVSQAKVLPQKPVLNTTTIQQNLQTFSKQFATEQQNFQNQRIANNQLQETIKKWGYTDGKKINNTTTLLATLHEIWPEWEKVSLTDMLKPEQVNAAFKKAVVKVHPDKNRHRHFKEKYLSKRVFQLLNQSRKQ